ncbi:MAG: aroK [Chthoniobacteraceae bacterium]|nr:aroK [Chthoniobacteraceae bacterium]
MSCQNIVLIGFMGSGKSSIGRLLSKKLGFQFVDTDRVIIERAGMEISDIFAQHGEDYFRDLESTTLASLAHLRRCIIATGGGVVLREANRALLSGLGFVVGLAADEEVIFERVSRNAKRPLLQTENPRETVRRILNERLNLYEAAAQFTVDTSQLTYEQIAEIIINEVRRAFQWQSAP